MIAKTTTIAALAALATGAGLFAFGCAEERAQVEPAAPTRAAAAPVVQPGATLVVTLDDGLMTSSAVDGQTFRATVRDPVYAQGEAVIERGAKVEGRVVDVEAGGEPRLWVVFDHVETVRGVVPLDAKVTAADAYAYIVPADRELIGPGVGGGPPSEDADEQEATSVEREILVPQGGELRLVVQQPIQIPAR